jgi:hypothetical protein
LVAAFRAAWKPSDKNCETKVRTSTTPEAGKPHEKGEKRDRKVSAFRDIRAMKTIETSKGTNCGNK